MYEYGTILGDPNMIFHRIVQNDAILDESGSIGLILHEIMLKNKKIAIFEVINEDRASTTPQR